MSRKTKPKPKPGRELPKYWRDTIDRRRRDWDRQEEIEELRKIDKEQKVQKGA